MSKTMLLKPRVSEKAYAVSSQLNTYVFKVPLSASKQSIASAVEDQFKVAVLDVNTAVVKGKAKRTVRKGGRRQEKGRQSDFKKAYVVLKEGDEISVFQSAEEDKKPEGKGEAK